MTAELCDNSALVEARYHEITDMARPEAVEYQHARGKLTARERIALLADEDSFCELGGLARPLEHGSDDQVVIADGIVTGTAEIDGRPVLLIVSDFTAAGGTNGALGGEKIRRCWELAASRGTPVVMLLEGGGHRIQEGLDSREFGVGFDLIEMETRLSGWVPLVGAILGPGFGGPALLASLCDYVVAVRGIATFGMAPPGLVKAAVGEDISAEELGGADAHASYGTIDAAVDSEADAMEAIRRYLSTMPSNASADLPVHQSRQPEAAAAAQLDSAVPTNFRRAYDMHRVIAGLIDADSLVELKTGYAPNMITAFGRLDGQIVGIVANQPMFRAGTLDSAACEKTARFVSLCDAYGIPLVVLIDLPGFGVGSESERSGLVRRSGKLIYEFGVATVPRMTVVVRKGYGGGYAAMSGGRTYHPELCLAWPHAETAVMPVETAVEVAYRREMAAASDPTARRAELIAKFKGQLDAFRAAEAFGVDAVVAPNETRALLARARRALPRHRMMVSTTPRRHGVAPM
jgi:propionyl-CoA carboxylase beta chain